MMFRRVIIGSWLGLFLIALTMVSQNVAAEDKVMNLLPFEWKQRILLINHADNSELNALQDKQQQAALDERYLLWFAIKDGQIKTNYKGELTQSFANHLLQSYPLNKHHILLIGYDGYIKLKLQDLDLPFIYQTIDGMPMRQMEMLRQ